MNDLLLASASPRREELLRRLAPAFDVVAANVDEDGLLARLDGPPGDIASGLAEAKVKRAAQLRRHRRVIGADTVVVVGGRPVGKPDNADAAGSLLEAVAGQDIEVVTGLALLDDGVLSHACVSSTLTMAERDYELIAAYVATGAWVDKAGGLEVQGRARALVRRIEGCWTNVVGLPLCAASALLGVTYPLGSCDLPDLPRS